MGEWSEDWVTALRSMPSIDRDREVTVETQRGGSYSYKYATLANVIDTVRAVLSEYEFGFAQEVTTVEDRIAVRTIFYHSTGHEIGFGPLELPTGSTPQTTGSAITYARRYALTAALGLATEDDDDGAAASRREERTQPPSQDAAAWLASKVRVLSEWSEEERRETVSQVMREQGITNPMSREDAEKVWEKTSAIYYEANPPSEDEAPF